MARHQTFTSLGLALEMAADELEENAAKIIQNVTTSVHEVVVENTPADTGRAISNWIISIGSRSNLQRAPFVAGRKGSTAFENRAFAIDHGRSKMRGYEDPEKRVVISNNINYIRKLNQGSSRQAPAGFVEEAVMSGVTSLRGARLLPRR